MRSLFLLLLLSAQASLLAQGIVLPENRRTEVLEGMTSLTVYTFPTLEERRMIPDPFTFGRELEEEEEEPDPLLAGLSTEEVLTRLSATLRSSIIGYQEFGGRSFFATKDYGLLRTGDTLVMPMPEAPGQNVSVTILNPDRTGFTLQMAEVEIYVPLNDNPSGITNSLP